MRLPHSLGEATKATKKKPLEAVTVFGSTGAALEEFGITESGNEIQAFVKTSPGDSITLGFGIPCTELQIVDIFIDGVLRESNITTSRPVNTHRGKITKVCACEMRPSGIKGKLEYCDMVVEDRRTTKDIRPSAPGFADLHTSAVGTIEVRILREIKSAAKSHKDLKAEQAVRGPTFEDNLRWWDVSKRVDSGLIAPTYQIGFVNGRKTQGNSRKNINRSIEGYYLWASFKFLYRSASDIHAAGLDNIDNLPDLSSNIKAGRSATSVGKMANTKSTTATNIEKKPILSPPAVSKPSVNQIDSDSLQPPEIGPVKGADESESTEHVQKELQVATPAKCTQVLDSAAVISNEDLKANQVEENQRSLHAYCETNNGDDEADKGQGVSVKSVLKIANQKMLEHEQPIEKVAKQTSLSGSRRAAIIVAEQAVASYAKEAVATDAQGDDIMPILSQAKNIQDVAANDKFLHSPSRSNTVSDKQEWDWRMRNLEQVFLPETNLNSPKKLCNSLNINSERFKEAVHRIQDGEDLSDVSSVYQPSSLSHVGGDGTAVQGPESDLAIELSPLEKVTNVQRTAPNSMMRAKAGHYISRSPLVDPDTEEMERHAKAMTNGKGDWRGRFTHLLQDLSAPSKNRALAEGPPSMAEQEYPIGTNLAAEFLPSSLSDTPKKRKFVEFNVDGDTALRPNTVLPSSLSKQSELGMSPKQRRGELARKKLVKREALEKAKAEADTLRRQVKEMEAGQSEAIAREEAELEELDMEIEKIQEEAQALAARLRELHEL